MESVNWLALVYGLVGGLGLFLYGMKMMSEGLQKSAGSSLRSILEKLTTNRVVGTFVGVVVTAIIQSSSATTVMVVGFVNAGLMNLAQALSVVLGANVGTTVTAQLIAFKIGKLALPAIGVGVFLRMFSSNKKHHYWGEVLIGFGLLFLGLKIMKDGFAPLKHSAFFREAFVTFSHNPVLAVAAGAILTMIVQSSSATIGITVAMASTGLIDYYAACALVLGENVGTTITANLAALGTNPAARRAAFGHFLINALGVCYMLIFLKFFMQTVDVMTPGDPNFVDANGSLPYIARHIANLHTGFNIINLLIFMPVLHILARFCEKVIPGKGTSRSDGLVFLDDCLIETPDFAIAQAKKEVSRMSGLSLDMLKLSRDAFFSRDAKTLNKIYQLENTVDILEKDISMFLVRLNQEQISAQTSREINNMLHVLHDLEKIGDYAENIATYTEKLMESGISFTEEAMGEMEEIFGVAIRFTENVMTAYNAGGQSRAIDTEDENVIDKMRKKFKKRHLARLQSGTCSVETGILFVDILNNLEKTGDQAFNIAQVIMGDT
ncbi:MAG: Na/Pi cotransporter family protein [Desulfobacterales bacterium]|nr:Na/Pi cotransporter family protein [Desulfobacterales bacterium]